MKDFFKYLLCIVIIVGITYSTLIYVSLYTLRHRLEVNISKNITTAVFGPSTGGCAINDSILDNYKNFCADGARYTIQEDFIKDFIDKTPQLHTIILCYEPLVYSKYSNAKFAEQDSTFLQQCKIYISYSLPHLLKIYPVKQLINFYINYDFLGQYKEIRGYKRVTRNNIHEGKWSEVWYDEEYKSVVDIPYNITKLTHSIEQQALRSIINYCLEKKINVVILCTPMYHLDRWIGRNGYEQFISTLNKSILIADYLDYPMPSDDYYADVQHLNDKGSDYFSTYIKTHGLKTESLEEYLKRKGKTLSNAE